MRRRCCGESRVATASALEDTLGFITLVKPTPGDAIAGAFSIHLVEVARVLPGTASKGLTNTPQATLRKLHSKDTWGSRRSGIVSVKFGGAAPVIVPWKRVRRLAAAVDVSGAGH